MVNIKGNETHTIFSNKRKTIGILVGSQSSYFQESIVRGANAMAKELDYNVITFAGGPMNPPKSSPQRRARIFELIDPKMFDGFIISLSSLARFSSTKEIQRFLEQFANIPIVNVSGYYKELINITADYASGLSALINHYITVHEYKRIALFRGPSNHNTSSNRHEIYKRELEKHKISYDENLVIYGDLDASTSNSFVTELLDIRKETCDAIITMNDSTALEVISILKARGIKIPEDIAVSGSMNTKDGKFSKPKLTTIQEPLSQLGEKAMRVLKEVFDGNEVMNNYHIPTTLVIRESCGCINNEMEESGYALFENKNKESVCTEITCMDFLKEYCKKEKKINSLVSKNGNIWDVLKDYEIALNSGSPEKFSRQIEEYINASLSDKNIVVWLDFMKKMQYKTMQCCLEKTNSYHQLQILNVLTNTLEFLHAKALTYQTQETKFYIDYLRKVSQNLNPSFDLAAIHKYIIKLLSLKNCFIMTYKNNKSKIKKVECIHALCQKQFLEFTKDQKIYNQQEILPSSIHPFLERYEFIIFPLYYKAEPLGYLFLDYNVQNSTAYENIQSLISASLKNELQQVDLRIAKERFKDIAHSTSDWLWETNAMGEFTYCSTSVYAVLGITSSQIMGSKIKDIVWEEKHEFIEKIDKGKTLLNINCYANHKNGDVRYLLVSGKPHKKDDKFVGYRGVIKDITNQIQQEEKIKHLAYYDILTGLPNRTLFQEKLQQKIAESKGKKKKFAIVFLDINRFKYINDSMGHSAGDIILQKVSSILQKSINKKDLLARIGGDEFTIIIADATSREEVKKTVETVITNLKPEMKLEGQSLYVTMSFGIAMYPTDGCDATILLKNADSAMYKAKECGRNQYVFFDQIIGEKNRTRLQQEELLHNAIRKHQFFLEYQPQVMTSTGEIYGFEALVRIHHDRIGTIYPDEFIPLAEELGLIGGIDEWVLNEVCQVLFQWKQAGLPMVPISVNMSATQLESENLVSNYVDIVMKNNIKPDYIQLEITENALIENEAKALKILMELKEKGFCIALDDFGTGYSSLTCVNLYPIDMIKIDRFFIIDSVTNKKSRAIIKTIMYMAKELDLKVVAEGVETMEQYELIKNLKCDLIQGYYFSKPKAMNTFQEMMVLKTCFSFEKKR